MMKYNAEAVFKPYKLFVYGDIHYELISWQHNCKKKERLTDYADLTDCYCNGQECFLGNTRVKL
jgi:hypothetical protein